MKRNDVPLGSVLPSNSSLPRGVRNNNPLNIRVGNDWQGEAAISRDNAFETFKSAEYGFRAATKVLRSYNRQGISTVAGIISRWAPSNENNTEHYINSVCGWTGFSRGQVIDVYNKEQVAKLLHAMSIMEVGRYYDMDTARAGVAMA
ncbi:virion protein [Thaumasiovibrio subtropicus]|uniref:virion protein n=1 Tax=Thaumasiovibrio subtropicus TaxID=1891207 RepID=UPI000B35CF09|nr:virion protein [Thaumasiovibrio subtropicus]